MRTVWQKQMGSLRMQILHQQNQQGHPARSQSLILWIDKWQCVLKGTGLWKKVSAKAGSKNIRTAFFQNAATADKAA